MNLPCEAASEASLEGNGWAQANDDGYDMRWDGVGC